MRRGLNPKTAADDSNVSNCFTKGSSAGGVAGDDCESDPGERLHFRPTTLFSFFDAKLAIILTADGSRDQSGIACSLLRELNFWVSTIASARA